MRERERAEGERERQREREREREERREPLKTSGRKRCSTRCITTLNLKLHRS